MRQTLRTLRERLAGGPPYDEELLALLRDDPRAGAQSLYRSCAWRVRRAEADEARMRAMMKFEREARERGFCRVAGVDEAGRGPLAGPIVAAAVVLNHPVPGLNDSKQLTAGQREALFAQLHEEGHGIGTAVVSAEEIDHSGIQCANYAAMARAVLRLEPGPDFLLVDGFSIPGCIVPQKRIVKGDARSQSIAAASIVAKVIRDRILVELDKHYPEYGFAQHKGYATASHLAAIEQYGPCDAHRRSFAPMAQSTETACLFEKGHEEQPTPCE